MKRVSLVICGVIFAFVLALPLGLAIANNCTPSEATGCYTVVSGDNLTKIAKKFGTSIAELQKLNNLTTDTIRIGQVLLVPNTDSAAEMVTPVNVTAEPNSTPNTSQTPAPDTLATPEPTAVETVEPYLLIYEVEAGETLEDIAKKFGTTVEEIIQINELESPDVLAGEFLLIFATIKPAKPGLAGDPATNPDLSNFGLRSDQLPAGYRERGYSSSDIATMEFYYNAPVVYAQSYGDLAHYERLNVYLLDVRGDGAENLEPDLTNEEIDALNAKNAEEIAQEGLSGSVFYYRIPMEPIGQKNAFYRYDYLVYDDGMDEENIFSDNGPYRIYDIETPEPVLTLLYTEREDTVLVESNGFLIIVEVSGDIAVGETNLYNNPLSFMYTLHTQLMEAFQKTAN